MNRETRFYRISSSFTGPHTIGLFFPYLNDKVYATKTSTITEMKVSIERESSQIPIEMLTAACDFIVSAMSGSYRTIQFENKEMTKPYDHAFKINTVYVCII